jgi:hypothetical protein
MVISRKSQKPLHPQLFMNGTPISSVAYHKHLGVTFSNDGSWHIHINSIKERAWKRIHIMRSLKFQLDRTSLETLYLTFVRPLLEYADVLYDNCTQYEKKN